jgi:hypothetical protein
LPLPGTARCLILIALAAGPCAAEEDHRIPDAPSAVTQPNDSAQSAPQKSSDTAQSKSTLKEIRDLPLVWLIGPYIPPTGPFQPLTNGQRREVYFRQTFLTVGAYLARMFSAGVDQAQGFPSQWEGGMSGYGKRFGNRYGQFVIQSSIMAAGNAALGYEPRYDLCRCTGFWPRTRHAISRNFVAYNRSERELRPQIPLYAGAFGAGMFSEIWLPGNRNPWRDGGYSALEQAGYGSGVNWVSEFALDILHKLGVHKR